MSIVVAERESQEVGLEEAAETVPDGAVVGIGGSVTTGHPMALVRALARRGVRDLTVVAPTAGLELDVLIAAGCVRKVLSCYVGAETLAGVGPVYKRAVEAGAIELVELDEAHCVMGLRAAGHRLPSMPWRGGVGTSYPALNPSLVPYEDPVTGDPVLAIPAIELDVALLHAETADRFGNGQTTTSGSMDPLLGAAAARVLLEADRIVDREELRRHPERTTYWRNALVVRCPFGTHPYSCGWLIADEEHLTELVSAGRDGQDGLDAYLRRYVFDPLDHESYLEQIGIRRLASLMI